MASKIERLIKFRCFYCLKFVEVTVVSRFQIKKAYCQNRVCTKKHRRNLHNSNHAKEYEIYLREIQKQVPNIKEIETPKIYRIEGDRFFRGKDYLGKVVKEDKGWVLVQSYIGGAIGVIRIFSKEQCST
jgi:hypothetical protein